jgi:hypothetical protein
MPQRRPTNLYTPEVFVKLMIAIQVLATIMVVGLVDHAFAAPQCKEIRWLGKYSRLFKADAPNLQKCIDSYCAQAKYSLVTSNGNFFTVPDIKKFALSQPERVKNCATHYTEDGKSIVLDTFEGAYDSSVLSVLGQECSHLFMGTGEATTCEIVYE